MENQNDPASQEGKVVNERVQDNLQREQIYPQRRRNCSNVYRHEQNGRYNTVVIAIVEVDHTAHF